MGELKKKVEGTASEAMGKVQEEAGKVMGQPGMEARGREKVMAGKAEKKLGSVQARMKKK